MSVAMTVPAVRARRKFVTRRVGWRFVKPGERLTLCEKVQGRRAGEPLARIVTVQVVSARREPLRALLDDPAYGAAEVALEGFAGMDPAEFVDQFFIRAQGLSVDAEVTRVEWRYLSTGDGAVG